MQVQEQEVKFESLELCLGRNGEVKTSGLLIRDLDGYIEMQPLTSRGVPARCLMQIPSDQRVLNQMAEVFTRLAARAAESLGK
ncbi:MULTISPECIES: hypothetical protein [Cupriavidus]|uniref:hypothetical protein n=1 Tax=Cupriavidus TaxID=106589 RepID=UPI0011EEE987|nr:MULTISPECIES: hypothetical protein [Cupriavidus]MWL91838.1 hypothetical protein [Cupriavidus sp. SW-Y-13]